MFPTITVVLFWALVSSTSAQITDRGTSATTPALVPPRNTNATVDQLIPWLLERNPELSEIHFSEVIGATTGKNILSFDRRSEVDRRVVEQLGEILDEALKRMNAPDSAMQRAVRINEVSSHVEDLRRELLSAVPGLSCDSPRT